LINCTV